MRYLERAWNDYRRMMLYDFDDSEVLELRMAFYSGVIYFVTLMLSTEGSIEEITKTNLDILSEITSEIEEFQKELKQILRERESNGH